MQITRKTRHNKDPKGTDKNCPLCGNEVKRRKKERCPFCGAKLYKYDGEYFTISKPQQRLIVYNWTKYLQDIDINIYGEDKEWVQYLPSSDDISIVMLKNEGWAANKLIKSAGKNFELALKIIDIYHEYKNNKEDIRRSRLFYLVSTPLFTVLIQRAKRRLMEEKMELASRVVSERMIEEKRNLGNPFGDNS